MKEAVPFMDLRGNLDASPQIRYRASLRYLRLTVSYSTVPECRAESMMGSQAEGSVCSVERMDLTTLLFHVRKNCRAEAFNFSKHLLNCLLFTRKASFHFISAGSENKIDRLVISIKGVGKGKY